MSKWEYAFKDFKDELGETDLKNRLDEMGDEGWELIIVTVPRVGWKRYMFKRIRTP